MTTWYTGGQLDQEPAYYAWSVRPDLWPPGSEIWVVGVGFMADWGHLAHLQAGHCGLQPAEGYSDPGAVEALVLSGQRVSSMGGTWGSTQTWTPWYRGPGDP